MMNFIVGVGVGMFVWQSLGLFRPGHILKYAVLERNPFGGNRLGVSEIKIPPKQTEPCWAKW